MSEHSDFIPLTKDEPTTQEAALRFAAIVTASIAVGGLIVWLGLRASEAYSDDTARVSDLNRSIISEKNRQLYVAVPPNAVQTRPVAPLQGEPVTLAMLPRSNRKPPAEAPVATAPLPDETMQSEPAPSDPDAPYAQAPPAEPTQHSSTLDDQAEQMNDEPSWNEPPPGEPEHDEPSWDEERSSEPFMDEPPPDEPDESDDPS